MEDVKPQQKLEKRIKLEISDLKSILQHSKNNKNFEGILYVYPSRYRKILSDYYALNAIEVEGMLDNYAINSDFYILSKLDDNGNSYKVVKDKGVKELKGKCENCDCGRKRMLNPESGKCYYKEAIETNYTTKI